MAKYRKIDPKIWNDKKFRPFTDRGKLSFLFLLSHPHMTSLGAMRATIPGLAAEISWPEKAFREAFAEALTEGMIKHDENASFVWLPNFLKYNPPESPNVLKAWENALDLLPECDLYNQLLLHVKDYAEGLTEGFAKALPEAFRKAMPYQEQEQEQEQEQDKHILSGVAPRPNPPYAEIIKYLNEKAGTAFSPATAKTKTCIRARWNEGFVLEDFKAVVDVKCDEWLTDEKMMKYLRPETLFSNKFEGYRQQSGGYKTKKRTWHVQKPTND